MLDSAFLAARPEARNLFFQADGHVMGHIDELGNGSLEHHGDDGKTREREHVQDVPWASPDAHLSPVLAPVTFHFNGDRMLNVEARATLTTHDMVLVKYTLNPGLKKGTSAFLNNQGGGEDDKEKGRTDEP